MLELKTAFLCYESVLSIFSSGEKETTPKNQPKNLNIPGKIKHWTKISWFLPLHRVGELMRCGSAP